MKKPTIIFILSALVLLSNNLLFAEVTAEVLIKKIAKQNEAIKDIKATIEVTIEMAGKEKTQTVGFWHKKPDKFKISMTGEQETTIISDGKYLYAKKGMYGETKKREIKNKEGMTLFQDNPLLMWEKFLKGYDYKLIKQEGKVYKLDLSPKTKVKTKPSSEEKQKPQNIEIYVDSEKGTAVRILTHLKGIESTVEIIEHKKFGNIFFPVKMRTEAIMGTRTIVSDILWKNVEINKGIADKEFILK